MPSVWFPQCTKVSTVMVRLPPWAMTTCASSNKLIRASVAVIDGSVKVKFLASSKVEVTKNCPSTSTVHCR